MSGGPASRALHFLAATALFYGLNAGPNLRAQAPKPTEYEVQAAYLSNFGRFVEWPAGAKVTGSEPFNVCVLGPDPFGLLLDAALKGETIFGAPMVAKRVAGPEDTSGCRILYIGSSKSERVKAILASLGTAGILTVSDAPGFTKLGGMIQFVLEGDRVRFEINLSAAQRSGLIMSSELLKVATAVRRTGQ